VARLFFALWPDEPARRALAGLAGRMAVEAGGRPVPAANLHLTLAFLGEVPDERVGTACAVAADVRAGAFDLVLDRTGTFRRAGVAWAGPSVLPAELDRLQSALESGLRAAGFALDARPFAPHLTLARRTVKPAPEAATAPVAWRVGRFALVRSARDKGAYAELAGWELGKED